MADNVLPLAHVVRHCPECRYGQLTPVHTSEEANLLCPRCGACWHADRHWLCRIDPAACPGCPLRGACVPEYVSHVTPVPA